MPTPLRSAARAALLVVAAAAALPSLPGCGGDREIVSIAVRSPGGTSTSASAFSSGLTVYAEAFYSDGEQRDATADVSWESSDEAVAVVVRSGGWASIDPVAPGTVRITARLEGASDGLTVLVTP